MKKPSAAMRKEADRPLVVVLNNDILPYRISLFQALASSPDFRFHFLFSTERAWDRAWQVDRESLRFPHTVLPGFAVRLRKRDYDEWRTIYINPTLPLVLAELRPDVVVGYEYSVPAMVALMCTRARRVAYVEWTDCTSQVERNLTHGQRWTRRWIIPRSQAYLGTSRAACENLVRLGAPERAVFESPMSHNVAWFEAEADHARSVMEPSPTKEILYVGHLNERKGVSSLLLAFSIVARDHPEARLNLIGDGRLRTRLEQTARRLGIGAQVTFGGFVQPDNLPATYAAAEVFVLPSLEDTFGVVVVEALACGVPVICSKHAGAASHLVDGSCAFVVDPEDAGLLADRIHQLLVDPDLRTRFIAEGRRVARSFDADTVALPFVAAVRTAYERLNR
jgi:glycosyltransferase involved in cell wall biosynthesis